MLFGWHVRYVLGSFFTRLPFSHQFLCGLYVSICLQCLRKLFFSFSYSLFRALSYRKKWLMFVSVFILYTCWGPDLSFWETFPQVWERPKLWQSHIILLVLVLLVLAGGLCGVDWFLFDYGAVGLCRVADVVATLVHVIRALISVAVFVHSVEQDEDAQCCCSHDANHHPGRAAGLPEHLRRAWVTGPGSGSSGISCKGNRHVLTTNARRPPCLRAAEATQWLMIWVSPLHTKPHALTVQRVDNKGQHVWYVRGRAFKTAVTLKWDTNTPWRETTWHSFMVKRYIHTVVILEMY